MTDAGPAWSGVNRAADEGSRVLHAIPGDRLAGTRMPVGGPPMNLAAVEIKAFVPALDLAQAMQFYLALGFEIPWSSDELAYVRHGNTSFLLQSFNVAAHADNFQMHLLVENVDDWHAHVRASGVGARFGVEIGEPEDRPWAMRDFTLLDPSGVLWRIAQNIPREGGA
jgi:Glyoxalase/Bleomycin resistance protein/Dioxygenase superfamily